MTEFDHVNILGTRGIPAGHGGFETFAERLALYLVSRGTRVTVYCQSGQGEDLAGREDFWRGIRRVHFGTRLKGAGGTIEFDMKSVRHVLGQVGVDLVLGYNTAVFNTLQRIMGRRVFMNMDGIEWQRQKWAPHERMWLKFNEYVGAKISNMPIADHPEIARHIENRTGISPVMIPYGADPVMAFETEPLSRFDVAPGRYFVSIARIEPENSILEIVRAFSRARTGMKFVVLGRIDPQNPYHRKILSASGQNVILPGAIYDDITVKALRFHARAYFHGHQVGGTNPSLVEALGAGSPVIAHDNRFNRWTAGRGQAFFSDVEQCTNELRRLAFDDVAVHKARIAARSRHHESFRWSDVLHAYEALLLGVRDHELGMKIAAE